MTQRLFTLGAGLVGLGLSCSGSNQAGEEDPAGGDGAEGATTSAEGGGSESSGASSDADLPAALEATAASVELSCEEGLDLPDGALLKLSTRQYQNTVRDLLGRVGLAAALQEVDPSLASIPDDSAIEGFRGLDDRIGIEHVQGYFEVGVAVANAITADDGRLEAVAGSCALQAELSEACREAFLDGFLALVHRRPLSAEQRTEYASLDDGTRDARAALRAMIIVGLSSPSFTYHLEIGGDAVGSSARLLTLDGYEVASKLSYTFWQTMPDQALLEAAADGSLLTREGYAAQLDRVWEDERTRATLRQFWTEWLKLDRFTGFQVERPAFAALAEGESVGEPGHDHYDDMLQEVADLTELFTFEQPGTLADLLTTDISVTRSEDLAALYGVEPWDGEGDYPRLPEGERAGLLQRGALLVADQESTNPFHRGALVRTRVLCDPLSLPDPNQLPPGSLDLPDTDAAQTTRERFAAKIEGNGLCATCHDTFTGIGYALESFDALGRHRTRERVYDESTGELLAELPLDTAATPRILPGDERPVAGAAELNRRIAESGKVEACLARNYFSYVARRAVRSRSLDACVLQDLTEQLSADAGGLAGALRRIAEAPTFLLRKVGSP